MVGFTKLFEYTAENEDLGIVMLANLSICKTNVTPYYNVGFLV